jgi:integrase
MMLRIEQGKGQRDRYVMLSPRLLEILREWWKWLCIPAKMNASSGDGERRFRASRTLIGANRRGQSVSCSSLR